MISEKLSELQVKHLVQVVVCMMGIYLLRTRSSYQFTPVWRHDLDLGTYQNGRYPARDEILPSPIVTDLEGDGRREIILITTDNKIEINRYEDRSKQGQLLPHLDLLYSTSLPPREKGEHPVVMETGYLDFYSTNETRAQVVIIVYNSFRVLCYDNKLNLLWQQNLLDLSGKLSEYNIKSMGVIVVPYSIHPGDHGLVIIGGSTVHRGHEHRGKTIDNSPDEQVEQRHGVPSTHVLNKFSTFALSGHNGTLKWQHVPNDKKQTSSTDEPAHHWKLSLKRGDWSQGTVHWSKFGSYFLEHTPHRWTNMEDTTFDLADIRRTDGRETSASMVAKTASPLHDLGPEHLIGQLFGGHRPHSRHDHVTSASAIVAHTDQGLEVLSLDSGQLITRIELNNHHATYGDINADGKLDEVIVNFGGVCQGEGATIHPRPKAIFAGSICPDGGWWLGPDTHADLEDTHLTVTPIVVDSVSRPSGLLNHLLGRSLPTERQGYDSIFLTSSGHVTSFNSRGHKNWQVETPASWLEQTKKSLELAGYEYSPGGSVYYHAFIPSMQPFSIKIYDKQRHAVIMGWNKLAVVDLEDGFVAADHSLPCPQIAPPVLSDFNADGLTDLIISCPSGYVGLTIKNKDQFIYMGILSAMVVLVMLLLTWCCQVNHTDMHERTQ